MVEKRTDAKIEKLAEAYYEKAKRVTTWSGFPVKEYYTPRDIADLDYERGVGDPGEYPYTRGIHKSMFRGRYWTRREVCGFGTPKDTNKRLLLQIQEGVSGLDVIVDMPTRFAIGVEHPLAEGEVGASGVSLISIEDMKDLTEGIPLDKVSFSLISSSCAAPVVLSQYIAVARSQGLDPANLRGTIQNDTLQTRYCGMGEATPIEVGVKMSVDIIEYCTRNMPSWYTLNVNLYDLRETGINAAQEIAFGFGNALAYIDGALGRGLKVDDFVPRIGFYCSAHIDLLEEIAKLRAARRLWARLMREKYDARNPRTMMFRFAIHTAGCSLVPDQPLNNIVRVAYEALAGVLAGAQSLHCCSYDEPICLPTEEAQRIALRTQQILAYETGVANCADPLAGSYYLESLTNKIEEEATSILKEIEGMGGMLAAMKNGWIGQEIEKAALNYQREVESGERVIVGLNQFTLPTKEKTPGGVHRYSPEGEKAQVAAVRRLKDTRDQGRVRRAIARLRARAEKGEKENLIPAIMEAVEAYATTEEIVGTVREAYGYSYDPFKMVKSPFSG